VAAAPVRNRWRLGLVLGLLALAGATAFFAPAVSERWDASSLPALPRTLAGWTSVDGAPEWALPVDPNERSAVRRTYQRGPDTAWVSVVLFSGQHEPDRRSAINLIHPEKNTVRIDRMPFDLALNGSPDRAVSLPAVLIQRTHDERLLVVYWHQMGYRAYGNEYAYRLALMRDILIDRHADMVLVRIAAPLAVGENPEQGLAHFRQIAPAIYAAVTTALDR
jgi:hypothetical protein